MRRLLTSSQKPSAVQPPRPPPGTSGQVCRRGGTPPNLRRLNPVGAKWGAIVGRHEATWSLLERPIFSLELVSSYSEPHRPTVRVCFASRGSGVQISSAPPETRRSEHGSGFSLIIWRARTGSQVVKFQAWRSPLCRGYGEDGIYFDYRAECRDSVQHKSCAGRWRGVVSLGFGADGKRIRKKVGGKTRTEVKESSRRCTRSWMRASGPHRATRSTRQWRTGSPRAFRTVPRRRSRSMRTRCVPCSRSSRPSHCGT